MLQTIPEHLVEVYMLDDSETDLVFRVSDVDLESFLRVLVQNKTNYFTVNRIRHDG